MNKFILDDLPGICNQEDFTHDYKLLMQYAEWLGLLAKDKGYKIPEEYSGFNLPN